MARKDHDPLLEQAIRRARRSNRRRGDSSPAAGELPFEDDHLAGRMTWGSLTVRLRRPDHRAVTELRTVMGFDDLPPADDPVLLLAHLLAGLATLLALLVDYLVAWSNELRQQYGSDFAAGLTSPVVPRP